jgi:hypothetical protein
MDAWASQSLPTLYADLYADLTEKIHFLSGQQLVPMRKRRGRPRKEKPDQDRMHKNNMTEITS